MISANVNSAFGVDLLVSDDYWIKHDQLAARDGRCVLWQAAILNVRQLWRLLAAFYCLPD